MEVWEKREKCAVARAVVAVLRSWSTQNQIVAILTYQNYVKNSTHKTRKKTTKIVKISCNSFVVEKEQCNFFVVNIYLVDFLRPQ